jgi:hypothetical protein
VRNYIHALYIYYWLIENLWGLDSLFPFKSVPFSRDWVETPLRIASKYRQPSSRSRPSHHVIRRYMSISHTWKTLLNYVFEDLRRTKAPNNGIYKRFSKKIKLKWLLIIDSFLYEVYFPKLNKYKVKSLVVRNLDPKLKTKSCSNKRKKDLQSIYNHIIKVLFKNIWIQITHGKYFIYYFTLK